MGCLRERRSGAVGGVWRVGKVGRGRSRAREERGGRLKELPTGALDGRGLVAGVEWRGSVRLSPFFVYFFFPFFFYCIGFGHQNNSKKLQVKYLWIP
jgi:hypothetical protein